MKLYLRILAIFLIIVSLLLLNLKPISSNFKNFFFLISSPIQKTLWKAGNKISIFFETISEIKNFKKENEELKLKIQAILSENLALKELKKENEILREALNLGLEKEFEFKLARVIGKDISQDSLIIDKGEKDKLSKDLPVINQQKILIGKISEVYQNFSRVQLLTHRDISFDVKFSEKEIYGLAKGKGNFNLSIELLPKEKEIQIGDKILTSALAGNFPKDLFVGEVKKIKKLDIEPFQETEVQPAFDFQKLDLLFVITNFQR